MKEYYILSFITTPTFDGPIAVEDYIYSIYDSREEAETALDKITKDYRGLTAKETERVRGKFRIVKIETRS